MTSTVFERLGTSHIGHLIRAWRRAALERAVLRSEYHALYLEESLRVTRLNAQALRVRLALLEERL
jgi:hypothetical protein